MSFINTTQQANNTTVPLGRVENTDTSSKTKRGKITDVYPESHTDVPSGTRYHDPRPKPVDEDLAHATTWENSEDVLSEGGQTRKDRYCMRSLML